jgi:hypothetical protein
MALDLFDSNDSDDEHDGSSGCLVWLGFLGALIISSLFVLEELRYVCVGRTAVASVLNVQAPTDDEDDGAVFRIRYSFVDASTNAPREESDSVPASWGPPPRELTVEYIAGRPGRSRVAGNRSYVALTVFGSLSLCVIGGFIYLYLDARRALSPYGSRRSRRPGRGRRRFTRFR